MGDNFSDFHHPRFYCLLIESSYLLDRHVLHLTSVESSDVLAQAFFLLAQLE